MNNINSNFNNDYHNDNENSFDLIKEFYKYFFFWRYFVLSIIICLSISYVTNRYTPRIFESNAKIQILDKKQTNLEMPTAEDLFSNTKINLENEIEIIKSSSIIDQVIKNLSLNLFVEDVGDIMTSRVLDYPFDIISRFTDSSSSISYNLLIKDNKLKIINSDTEIEYFFNSLTSNGVKHDLPFDIINVKKEKWTDNSYNLNFISSYELTNDFKDKIEVTKIGTKSDIINLNLKSSNSIYARNVLNEIIDVFNNDGVQDRQLINKRTIDFVNERYLYLATELESIESEKQLFKSNNDLVDIVVNSEISLAKSSMFEENIFSNENQSFIVSNLLEELLKLDFELLPSNIGIENIEINSMIESYNQSILEQRKLITSAGPNNPYVKQLNNTIKDVRLNIFSSLQNYLSQLSILKEKLIFKSNTVQKNVDNIPLQQKNLRAIERNQHIKEALYLFLLQRGEEAQVSYAITEPSIKVIEYAISGKNPISPNTKVIYIGGILFGLLIPFAILYFIFLFDNKVQSRQELEFANLNVVGEIPFFDLPEIEKVFSNPTDRSVISESFRILMSNIRYLEKNDSESNVILVTSSIKGEGKTLNALNLALSFTSVGKKVLLIGCDLRNPQLHKYINYDKNTAGIVDYLVDNKTEWKKSIINPFDSQPLDILLSGPIAPNPLNLINNGNIDILLKDARKTYDYIIMDSAPTLLVADTQSLINKSDILIFMTRCNVTDKEILTQISKKSKEVDANVAVILNGVGQENSYGYSYGYRYGYGYNYKYSYNYGYGYGYNSDEN